MKLSRRHFLKAVAATTVAPMVLSGCRPIPGNPTPVMLDSLLPINTDDDTPAATQALFASSVASGDPSPSGVVIWTRLSPELLVEGEQLYFQVAADMNFNDTLIDGYVEAGDIKPERDYTVAIDLDGQLESYTSYYYRFVYNGVSSRTGRCKTAPAADADVSDLSFGILSCQDYTNGYYGALNYLAGDDNLDYVLHLGDFIYESVGDPRFQSLPFADRIITLPSGQSVIMDLADYRHTYKTYRSDLNLQRAMERFTWIITTDDHETCNDCYWDYERDTLGAPDHPFTLDEQYGNDPQRLRQLKLDAQRAWLEWVPARVQVQADAEHPHRFSRIYRHLKFGQLLDLHMLDTRTYRSEHPCGEDDFGERYGVNSKNCENLNSNTSDRTILGAEQKQWLFDGLSNGQSRWQVLGNQTFLGKLAVAGKSGTAFFNVDAWDGYDSERQELLAVAREEVDNFVVLTGDLHTYIGSHVADNMDQNTLREDDMIGVEFMTPSVTSSGLTDAVGRIFRREEQQEAIESLAETVVKFTNPHIEFFNSAKHGYSTIRFTKTHCDWTAYAVDKDIATQRNARWELAVYRKEIGNPRLQSNHL